MDLNLIFWVLEQRVNHNNWTQLSFHSSWLKVSNKWMADRLRIKWLLTIAQYKEIKINANSIYLKNGQVKGN